MRKDLLKYYEALGLSPGATPEEIKRSYRTLLRRWHPDLYKARSLMQTTAADITKELNEAYEFLIKKKLYRQFPPRAERQPFVSEPEAEATPKQARYAYERAAPPPPPPPPPKPPKPRPAAATPKPTPPPRPPPPPKTAAPRSNRRWPWFVIAATAAAFWLASWWNLPPTRTPADLPSPRDVATMLPAVPSPAAKIVSKPTALSGTANAATAERAPATARVADVAPWSSPPTTAPRSSAALGRPPQFSPRLPTPSASPWALRDAPPGALQSADWLRLVAQVRRELETFEVGDSKARVIAIQGEPDERGENVFRYGSSLIYFRQGLVSDWTNRWPSLRVRAPESLGYGLLDTFTYRSSRNEVVRAQGQPTRVTGRSYYYGSSVVNFDREWVSSWDVGDRPLKARDAADLWPSDGNPPRLPASFEAARVAPRN